LKGSFSIQTNGKTLNSSGLALFCYIVNI